MVEEIDQQDRADGDGLWMPSCLRWWQSIL